MTLSRAAGELSGAGTLPGWAARGRRASVKLPWRKRSRVRRILGRDYATGYVVRRGAIAIAVVLSLINLPDLIRYVKIELM